MGDLIFEDPELYGTCQYFGTGYSYMLLYTITELCKGRLQKNKAIGQNLDLCKSVDRP